MPAKATFTSSESDQVFTAKDMASAARKAWRSNKKCHTFTVTREDEEGVQQEGHYKLESGDPFQTKKSFQLKAERKDRGAKRFVGLGE